MSRLISSTLGTVTDRLSQCSCEWEVRAKINCSDFTERSWSQVGGNKGGVSGGASVQMTFKLSRTSWGSWAKTEKAVQMLLADRLSMKEVRLGKVVRRKLSNSWLSKTNMRFLLRQVKHRRRGSLSCCWSWQVAALSKGVNKPTRSPSALLEAYCWRECIKVDKYQSQTVYPSMVISFSCARMGNG